MNVATHGQNRNNHQIIIWLIASVEIANILGIERTTLHHIGIVDSMIGPLIMTGYVILGS